MRSVVAVLLLVTPLSRGMRVLYPPLPRSAFHRRTLSLVSSEVGDLPPAMVNADGFQRGALAAPNAWWRQDATTMQLVVALPEDLQIIRLQNPPLVLNIILRLALGVLPLSATVPLRVIEAV